MGRGYRRRPSNLRLDGYNVGKGGGKVIVKQDTQYIDPKQDPEYIDIRNYVIGNFLTPLIKKKWNVVKENFFNFDYIFSKLYKFDNPNVQDEVDFLIKIVEVMQTSVQTRFTIDDANQKIYGKTAGNLILVETSRIVLQAKYEVYNIIFGDPMLDDRDLDIEYKPNLLEAIAKALDDYPGASIDLLKDKLRPLYGKFFLIK